MEHLPDLDRRHALKLLAGAAFATLVGCGADRNGETASTTTTSSTTSSSTAGSQASGGSCEEIPGETAGPFPGDGSNGPDVLGQDGVVRSDITASFGSMTGSAAGVPLTVELRIQDAAKGCAAMAGAAVYLWQCDREGRYSLYSPGATDQNYLRGVQEAGSDGRVTFRSVFPGAYPGRWPHLHFAVYPSLAAARSGQGEIATSQLALPEAACRQVYEGADGYGASVRHLSQLSLERDGVFRDGADRQLAATTGSITAGYAAALVVPV